MHKGTNLAEKVLIGIFSLTLISTWSISPIFSMGYLPLPGDWFGTTSQGRSVDFEINEAGTHMPYFQIAYEKDCGETTEIEIWYVITLPGGDGIEIIDNQFVIEGWHGNVFTGTFTSEVTNTGVFIVDYYDINLGAWCYAEGSWTAIPESLSFDTYMPIFYSISN